MPTALPGPGFLVSKPAPMLVVLNLLLAACAFVLLGIALAKSGGHEGPVGAHMVTGPFALLHAVVVAIAAWNGAFALVPGQGWTAGAALPGSVIALTALPILAIGPRDRFHPARLLVVAILAATFLLIDTTGVLQVVGAAGVLLSGLVGYGFVGALFVRSVRNDIASAHQDRERMDSFRANQAEFHRNEYAKLPAEAELWQLIPLVHAFDPEVQRLVRERIAAMPGLESKMIDLLGTGWGEHAVDYLVAGYPLPLRPLAPAYAKLLDVQREHWTTTLRSAERPDTWSANIERFFVLADKIVRDGGRLGPELRGWLELLRSVRGLGHLVALVERTLALPG